MRALLLGTLLGALGALPGLALARRARKGGSVSIGLGLGIQVLSLVTLSTLSALASLYLGSQALPLCAALAVTYLALWWVEAILAWRWMRPDCE